MDVKQALIAPYVFAASNAQTRTVSVGEEGDNREKYEGHIDTLYDFYQKTAIV